MKVAIVHYWLVGMRGGEKVLEEFCKLYPQADIYTHAAIPENLSDTIRRHRITETFIARLPGGRKHYQKYLPLMPRALDLTGYDLVISSESGPAKGVITHPDALHVCYCHSPMRYIWDQYHIYRAEAGRLTRLMMPWLAHRLRIWDTASAARVDHFVANSGFIARRIAKSWRREAAVIYPPVDVSAFSGPDLAEPEDFYLYAGELASYKRPDLVVDAFTRSGKPLVVIGEGSERRALEARAGSNVRFLGRVSFEDLKDHYRRCRALVFPGVEDFGIIPLEVMASGRPVLAFAEGGAMETVIEGRTGMFFHEPTVEAVLEGVEALERVLPGFDPQALRDHAAGFTAERFRAEFKAFVEARQAELAHHRTNPQGAVAAS
ncbi:glycosyl transferase (plasmid) [Sagittula sp. P11]|uniref:glycosyltransferase n=1 Tax=Sagittula sp. P11 TaxID=2009329 RepID=UPI000C2D5994|nr:glycosyltransferase [Sagittula sp. P11]AUC56763.1 glycosyl transferase [Sagittula sp. P11]